MNPAIIVFCTGALVAVLLWLVSFAVNEKPDKNYGFGNAGRVIKLMLDECKMQDKKSATFTLEGVGTLENCTVIIKVIPNVRGTMPEFHHLSKIKVSDEEFTRLYKEHGAAALANKFGVRCCSIYRKAQRLGIGKMRVKRIRDRKKKFLEKVGTVVFGKGGVMPGGLPQKEY